MVVKANEHPRDLGRTPRLGIENIVCERVVVCSWPLTYYGCHFWI